MTFPLQTRLASIAVVSATLLLAGCSSQASIDGVWSASDGSIKTISSNGACTGMYYNGGQPLDIGGPMSCALSSGQTDGYYTLVVTQPPNQASYQVEFNGDTMTLLNGGVEIVVLTRQ